MECLNIPVDHRLAKIIQRLKISAHYDESSHLNIMEAWGRSLLYGEDPIPNTELNHGLDLAGPGTKGGILVALLEPARHQTFENGFMADFRNCRTTDAVGELIRTASGWRLTPDDVAIFDTKPYVPGGSKNPDIVRDAETVFSRMVKAKEPDVVLCCYKRDSNDPVVKGLSSLGVGKVFRQPHFNVAENVSMTRVNVFHPSYAVNYKPTYSCFRRLLLLEFVKGLWQCSSSPWKEEIWMDKLRTHCIKVSSDLSKTERGTIDENRWDAILNGIEKALLKLNHFDRSVSHDQVVQSDLSWLCADASLSLRQVQEVREDLALPIVQSLSQHLVQWCRRAYGHLQLHSNRNLTDRPGLIAPEDISRRPNPPDRHMRDLHTHFFTFLKDLNFSFVWDGGDGHTWNIAAQIDAFQRFAVNLEAVAGRKSDLVPAGSEESLPAKFASLGV